MKSTGNSTYSELLARHQALEEEVMGIKTKKEARPRATAEYRKAFTEFLYGEPPSNALRIGKEGGGGYLVPDEFEDRIIKGLTDANVFRKFAHIVQADHDKRIPITLAHGNAVWMAESGTIPDSEEKFGQVILKAHKAAISIRISEELLEDAGFDMEDYVIREFAQRLGELEEDAFVDGSGNGMPTGILQTATLGATTEETNKISVDDMIELQYSLKEKYRANAIWIMSDSVKRELRRAKNTIGRPLWEDALSEGDPDRFLGRPVAVCRAMPNMAPGAKAVLLGDFSFFWIAERGRRSFKRLNELYAGSGQVGFIASQRVDAQLIIPEAVKFLQIKE